MKKRALYNYILMFIFIFMPYLFSSDSHIFSEIDANDIPMLVVAADGNNIKVLEDMLDQGLNSNVIASNGVTPLYIAAQQNKPDFVHLLLMRGANPNMAVKDSGTPLMQAVYHGHENVVKLLLRGVTRRLIDSDYEEEVRAAPNMEAGFREADNSIHYETPLSLAIRQGYVGIIKLLLENGANPNQVIPDSEGMTPFFVAIRQGSLEIIELLLQHGADPNQIISGSGGRTPLFVAIKKASAEFVELLLKYGADPNDAVLKPLYHAINKGSTEIVRLLLEYGANPNPKPTPGETTPLLLAISKGHENIVRMLLKYNANPNQEEIPTVLILIDKEGKYGETPLMFAIAKDNKNIVKILLEGVEVKVKKDIDQVTKAGGGASASSERTTVQVINKADPNFVSTTKQTPLSVAIESNNFDIVKMLLDHGALINEALINKIQSDPNAYQTLKEAIRYSREKIKAKENIIRKDILESEKKELDALISENPIVPSYQAELQEERNRIQAKRKQERDRLKEISRKQKLEQMEIEKTYEREREKISREEDRDFNNLFAQEANEQRRLKQKIADEARVSKQKKQQEEQRLITLRGKYIVKFNEIFLKNNGFASKEIFELEQFLNAVLQIINTVKREQLPLIKKLSKYANLNVEWNHIAHIGINKIEVGDNLSSFEFTGGHIKAVIDNLIAYNLASRVNVQTLPGGVIKYTLKNLITGQEFVKTVFPEKWTLLKIAEALSKGVVGQEQIVDDGIVEIMISYENVLMKVVLSSDKKKIITIYPVDSTPSAGGAAQTTQSAPRAKVGGRVVNITQQPTSHAKAWSQPDTTISTPSLQEAHAQQFIDREREETVAGGAAKTRSSAKQQNVSRAKAGAQAVAMIEQAKGKESPVSTPFGQGRTLVLGKKKN